MATPELGIILYITQLIKHKKMGCTMGTICALTYANVFMAQFQEKHTYPYIKDMSLFYLKYSDDILIIWKGIIVEYPILRHNGINQQSNF